MKFKYLKLIAKTTEDLKVISAHLQDSIVSTNDIANLKKNRIFLMQLNRFMWEDVEKGVFRKNKRIRTVLKFENVLKVSSKNIKLNDNEIFLDFLAGNSVIKVVAEVIEVSLDDQGEPWSTKSKPKHKFL